MNKILLTIQDVTGHSEVEIKWDPNNPEQVESIREMFIEMKKKGFMFFKVDTNFSTVSKGDLLEDFDPELKTMFMEKNLDWQPVESENTSSNQAEFVDVEKDPIEADKQYVAAQPLAGG